LAGRHAGHGPLGLHRDHEGDGEKIGSNWCRAPRILFRGRPRPFGNNLLFPVNALWNEKGQGFYKIHLLVIKD
jgi:hypothetical protein